MSSINDIANLYKEIYSIEEGFGPEYQRKGKKAIKQLELNPLAKSSGAGALSPEAAEELGDKAKELRKKKLATVDLPSINKEEVEEDALEKEAMKPEHRNPKGTPKKARGGDPRAVKEDVCPICGEDPCQCLEGTISEIHTVAKDTEVPSGNIKKLVKNAVKRIDTDVDGDTDHNDKAKGELGEFIPGVGNKRLYSNTGVKTALQNNFSDWRGEFVDEAHWNPIRNRVEDKPASKEEIESLAAKARTKKKTRKPLGSIRKNSATFKPSSPEQAKADKASWDAYWEGSWKEGYVPEEKRISREGALQALHNHRYSKKELWDMQRKATDNGDHGMASALYKKWKEMKEEVISEREMTKSEMKKEDKLKKKYDDSEMKQNMIDKYGKEKGTQIYFATIRKQAMQDSFDYDDAYGYIIEMLVAADYAKDYEAAEVMFEHLSVEFTSAILEEYIEEKARGTRKKKTAHIYDMDETLYGHDHSKVRVHVNDHTGKRVQSLSNQEFNTHKLQPGHKYDFSEFGSSKTFQKSAKPLKKMIKHMKRQKARGYDTHIVTARSDFDDKHHLAKQLKRHGVDITPNKQGTHTHLHRSGNEEGTDVGKKKQKVLSRLAARHGYSKIHMYDDAEKVHKATHGKTPGVKVKGHMVKPNKSGEVYSRPYKPTQPKGGKNNNTQKEETAYEYWKQFI